MSDHESTSSPENIFRCKKFGLNPYWIFIVFVLKQIVPKDLFFPKDLFVVLIQQFLALYSCIIKETEYLFTIGSSGRIPILF